MNNKIYKLCNALFWQYVVVTVIMMLLYSAGNRYAPELSHYVWDQNYLSDLGRSVSFAGVDNPAYIFYSLTLGLVGVGILLFFILIFSTISSAFKYLVLFLAMVSAIGYIGIAFYPVNENIGRHIMFGRLAYFSFFFTTVVTQILLDGNRYKTANTLFYVLNIMLFLYLLLMLFGPSSSVGEWALQLKTITQKLMVYSQIFLSMGILKFFHKIEFYSKAQL